MGYDIIAVRHPSRSNLPQNAREISENIWETIYTHYYKLDDKYYTIDNSSQTVDISINVGTADAIRNGLLPEGRVLFDRIFNGTVVDSRFGTELAEAILIALEQGELAALSVELVQNIAIFLRFAGEDGLFIVA
jgi:hypothetical protein